jgi:hypothetical protein
METMEESLSANSGVLMTGPFFVLWVHGFGHGLNNGSNILSIIRIDVSISEREPIRISFVNRRGIKESIASQHALAGWRFWRMNK